MAATAEPIVTECARLGEGALWHGPSQRLYWVDITGQRVFVFDPKTGENRSVHVGSDVGTIVPRKSGGVMLAVQGGFAHLDLDSGKLEEMAMVEDHLPGNRFNDGKCDPAGRFWAGSMAYDLTKGAGSLYCMEPDLTVRTVLADVTLSNGLTWSPDEKTFYYIDSTTSQIAAFDYENASGSITNRRVVVEITEADGLLDGMAIDENGNLWVAVYYTGQICCWNPSNGKLLDRIDVPGAKLTTSCGFGGPELKDLYITTASDGLTEQEKAEQPNAGALFKVRLDVAGTPANAFEG